MPKKRKVKKINQKAVGAMSRWGIGNIYIQKGACNTVFLMEGNTIVDFLTSFFGRPGALDSRP